MNTATIRYERTRHPESDTRDEGAPLTAYNVYADGVPVGMVWQVSSGHYWGKKGRTTGWTFVPQVTWTYTDAPFQEEQDTRRDATSSLVHASQAKDRA